ncbi:MAG: HNH endonuclease signature motif containing protein [Mycobacterium sp.]
MFAAAVATLTEGVDALADIDPAGLGIAEQLRLLDVLETMRRRLTAVSHTVALAAAKSDAPTVMAKAIADAIRVTPAEVRRRLRDAEQLAPRSTLTGEPLPAVMPATAQAWHTGSLDGEHVRVIQKFLRDLPTDIAPNVIADSEAFLASHAQQLRPDQLEKLAVQLAMRVNPDGRFSDEDRARQRGFTWTRGQRPDGMSTGTLVATPEMRAMIDALLAKFAAPGICNPADQSPLTDGQASPEAAERDTRSHAQRQHDALAAVFRATLGDPKLGQHNGLPVTVIATATIQDLHAKTGHAVTASGAYLPIRDLIRMATPAYHYLSIFDGVTGRALWLGRTKRIASPDQRIVLHAKDRGCTHPGCDMPGYLCEVHHIDDWAQGGPTDIDNLTFACAPHHKLLSKGWRTTKLTNGQTQWIPTPQLPLPNTTNNYHHPERFFDAEMPGEPDDPLP